MWSSGRAGARVRVSYFLEDARGVGGHRLGVNAAAVQGGDANWTLWTGGRDATVRAWSVNDGDKALPRHTCSGHSDWVNAVVCLGSGTVGTANNGDGHMEGMRTPVVASASSDTTVRLWAASGDPVFTVRRHTDYVRALAYAPLRRALVSGGLDKRIYMWDLEVLSGAAGDASAPSASVDDAKDSVYCVAVDAAGHIVAAGCPQQVVRVWDMRANRRIAKLRGHIGNIRAVLLNAGGTMCVSGSSDHTVRVWDLGQQRCVLTSESHVDSVWALAADDGFARIVSGGRDRSVCLTDIRTGDSRLVCTTGAPVLSVCPTPSFSSVWVTTSDPHVECWALGASDREQGAAGAISAPANGAAMAHRPAPICRIEGFPGAVQHHVLNDRRHVLVRDSSGALSVWDVTQARCVREMGVMDWQRAVEELSEMTSVPSWFSLECKTGALAVNLDASQCFAAEVYALDICDQAPSEDAKVNLGGAVLQALFRGWRDASPDAVKGGATVAKAVGDDAGALSSSTAPPLEEDQRYFTMPGHVTVVLSEETGGNSVPLFRRTVAEIGTEDSVRELAAAPQWLTDCVLKGVFRAKDQKMQFLLVPHANAGEAALPPLPEGVQSKLSAHRVLKVKRVCKYIAEKLKLPVPEGGGPEDVVDILCGEKVMPLDINIATIRQFLWKGASDDFALSYRRRMALPPENAPVQAP